jgi:hypothetical protein
MKIATFLGVLAALLMSSNGHAQVQAANSDPGVEAAVMQVLKDYIDAFNRLDVVAFERTLHFPYYRLASERMTVLDRAGQETSEQLRNGVGPEWDHSQWGRLRIIHSSSDKVHVDTLFTRYRRDGSIISSFESLYVVTKEQGRWLSKQIIKGGLLAPPE